ncbi:hypothetical protein D3C74_449610 [compost metagenome]
MWQVLLLFTNPFISSFYPVHVVSLIGHSRIRPDMSRYIESLRIPRPCAPRQRSHRSLPSLPCSCSQTKFSPH